MPYRVLIIDWNYTNAVSNGLTLVEYQYLKADFLSCQYIRGAQSVEQYLLKVAPQQSCSLIVYMGIPAEIACWMCLESQCVDVSQDNGDIMPE